MSDKIENQNPEEAVQVEVKENPLLKKIQLPGQKFRMPSKGLFYKNGELADNVEDGEVEVFAMKTIDEINLKTPDMIFQGSAIKRVFERCIPEVKKPMQLLSDDVEFLLGCLRQVSYGDHLTVKYACGCIDKKGEAVKPQEYNISLNSILVNNTKEIDPQNLDKEYLADIELMNGQTIQVQFHPMAYDNAVKIMQFQALELGTIPDNISTFVDDTVPDAADAALGKLLIMTLSASIASVDGHTDRNDIDEWCAELTAVDRDKVMERIANIGSWGTDYSHKTECKVCGKQIDLRTALDPVGFFMQPSNQTDSE